MARIGIIGALDDEIAIYLAKMKTASRFKVAGFDFHTGKLEGKSVVIAKCGVGKVNASSCAQAMIDGFSVSCVIVTGVAGALHPLLDTNHIVISQTSIQHDLDGQGLGFDRGQVPFSDKKVFRASEHLVKIASSKARQMGLKSMEGTVLSGDQFISDAETRKRLRADFGGDCVDMESAAVAHICDANGIPHIIIRSISDKADASALEDFNASCKIAAANSAKLVELIVCDLDGHDAKPAPHNLKSAIRTVPHWPKQGVMFRDVTILLKDKRSFKCAIDLLADRYMDYQLDSVAGIEARGFIFGAALAHRLGIGFIPIRKAGKLPSNTISEEYSLEYGKEKMEIHSDALSKGDNILLVDDLLATGGTALGACRLISRLGGNVVECCFVICLPELGGKKKLQEAKYDVFYLMEFEGE